MHINTVSDEQFYVPVNSAYSATFKELESKENIAYVKAQKILHIILYKSFLKRLENNMRTK